MITIDKIFENNTTTIVYATNNKYAKYMAVSIQSAILNMSSNQNYDIIIFETDVNQELKNIIESMSDDYNNVSIRFINTASIYNKEDSKKLFCHIYFSKEMYLRLYIPQILKNYDKAIYLDCDTIVQADLAELFNTNIHNYCIGAAKDFNTIVNFQNMPEVNYYFDKVIKMKNMKNYFNSGVLLMNLNELRSMNIVEECFKLLEIHKELLYPDQDLLNLICADKTKILTNSWNFVFAINTALVLNNQFLDLAVEWTKGLADQKIIHYISEHKPWNLPEMSYADIWWKYAKKTPIYQALLKEYFDAHPEKLAQYKNL